jgi:hypothetical protein
MRQILFAAALALGLAACGSSSGSVKLYLTDAPLDGATEVNVVVHGVELYGTGAPVKLTFEEPRSFNLLDYRDGRRAELGEVQVEGKINQIRLMIDGTATVVFEDESTRTASVPSGAQTGVKIIMSEIDPAQVGEITLDFDAAKSIHEAGGRLVMKPTITAIVEGAVIGESETVE